MRPQTYNTPWSTRVSQSNATQRTPRLIQAACLAALVLIGAYIILDQVSLLRGEVAQAPCAVGDGWATASGVHLEPGVFGAKSWAEFSVPVDAHDFCLGHGTEAISTSVAGYEPGRIYMRIGNRWTTWRWLGGALEVYTDPSDWWVVYHRKLTANPS